MHSDRLDVVDVAVIGAGFGGLGAALTLAESGARVVVLEALNYPGGCASTFTRGGSRYEAGATLFSGFADGHLFAEWISRHKMNVSVDLLDPLVSVRTERFALDVSSDRAVFVERICALAPEHATQLRAFFETQRRIADVLWGIFRDHALLPPFDLRSLLTHVRSVPRYAPLLRWIGRPLAAVVAAHGLATCSVLATYLDAVCQITVQASAAEAESLFALGAMDYFFRGTGHVVGGIGELAWAMTRAIEACGSQVRFTDRANRITREDAMWRVQSRRSVLRAKHVVCNVLPESAASLMGIELTTHRALHALDADVKTGWGAVMIYARLLDEAPLSERAHHLELVHDDGAPMLEGNHVFCSISARAEHPRGQRTATMSTHVPMPKFGALTAQERATYVASVQARMRATLRARAPEVAHAVVHELTASPRTFERFTRRTGGYVGGVPRRAGLSNYTQKLGPVEFAGGLWLVGDTVFPGQSTLATALGGVRTAAAIRAFV